MKGARDLTAGWLMLAANEVVPEVQAGVLDAVRNGMAQPVGVNPG